VSLCVIAETPKGAVCSSWEVQEMNEWPSYYASAGESIRKDDYSSMFEKVESPWRRLCSLNGRIIANDKPGKVWKEAVVGGLHLQCAH
jgi:hypothetical protein